MAISKEDYAYLSSMAYLSWERGKNTTDSPSGIIYDVAEVIDDPAGYYGLIFINRSTKEIVVAHRGTEAPGDVVQDLVLADGQMALLLVNQQLSAAKWAVGRALELSAQDPTRPPVTITGHSLGGALSQLTAVHYGVSATTSDYFLGPTRPRAQKAAHRVGNTQ